MALLNDSLSWVIFIVFVFASVTIYFKFIRSKNRRQINIIIKLENAYLENMYYQLYLREKLSFLGEHPKYQMRYKLDDIQFIWPSFVVPHHIISPWFTVKLIVKRSNSAVYDHIKDTLSNFKAVTQDQLHSRLTGLTDIVEMKKREAEDYYRLKKSIKFKTPNWFWLFMLMMLVFITLMVIQFSVDLPYQDEGNEVFRFDHTLPENKNNHSIVFIVPKNGYYEIHMRVANLTGKFLSVDYAISISGDVRIDEFRNGTYGLRNDEWVSLDWKERYYLHKGDIIEVEFETENDLVISINNDLMFPEWLFGTISVVAMFLSLTLISYYIFYFIIGNKFEEYPFLIDYYEQDTHHFIDRMETNSISRKFILFFLIGWYSTSTLIMYFLSEIGILEGLNVYYFGSWGPFMASLFILVQILPVSYLKMKYGIEQNDENFLLLIGVIAIIVSQIVIFDGFRYLILETWRWLF
ncbi:MAG: hypothetical protein INQ03_10745 [Candidatus Heimdallarchaeota archaeon]|nr:hypothetical protein [Candidatus Heimdallarchaeota archaeon]